MEKQVFNGSDRSHHIAMRVLSLQISSSDKGLMHRVVCEHSVSKLKDLETFLKNSEDSGNWEPKVPGICVDLLSSILHVHFGYLLITLEVKQRSGGPNTGHALFFWFI